MPQTALENIDATETVIDAPQQPEEKSEEDQEFEIEIVDDTPEEDQGRKTMPEEIVEDLENDELEEYSKEKGKQLKKVWNDERRLKESALRERDYAAKLAKQAIEENKQLKEYLSVGEKSLMDSSKSGAEHELQLAKKTFKEAYDAGDADAVTDAQEKLVSAKINLQNAESYIPQYPEGGLQEQQDSVNKYNWAIEPQEAPPPVQDERAKLWLEQNKDWWNTNDPMTSMALGLHRQLQGEGVAVSSDEYYKRIDKEMRTRFPEKFEQEAEESPPTNRGNGQSQQTVVSPAKRSTGSKRVVLTNSEVRLASRLNLIPEQYVREKLKLEA